MAMDLPRHVVKLPLTGSAPQIKWAQAIRSKRAQQMQALTLRVIIIAMRPHLTEEHFVAMGCFGRKNILRFIHGVCQHALSCPDANWWIANRDDPVHKQIVPSMLACIEHYSLTKPFQ